MAVALPEPPSSSGSEAPTTADAAAGGGYAFMVLVALQVGLQPSVTRACVPQAVSGRSLVLAEMAVSMVLAVVVVPSEAFSGWSALASLWLAGPPAAVYALRSLLKQAAYRLCDGVTFNIVNQTKVVFCAVAAWLLLGEGQTLQQCAALLCAVAAGALLVGAPSRSAGNGRSPRACCGGSQQRFAIEGSGESCCKETALAEPRLGGAASAGAALALGTAACSGLAAALSQAAMAGRSRPSALFNLELALWGAPLVALTGGAECPSRALRGWHKLTLAPVLLQAAGGLLVSAVVKQQGGVAMGLCTVAGIAVSAVVDAALTRRPPSLRQVCAAGLCGVSVYVHQLDGRALPGGQPLELQVPPARILATSKASALAI